jgi:hypothetical protein
MSFLVEFKPRLPLHRFALSRQNFVPPPHLLKIFNLEEPGYNSCNGQTKSGCSKRFLVKQAEVKYHDVNNITELSTLRSYVSGEF